MMPTTTGDMARAFALNTRSAELRQRLTRLGTEIASGRATDPVRKLGGNLSRLAQIENDLVLLAAHRMTAREAQSAAAAMQTALDRVAHATDGLVGTLTLATSAAGPTDISTAANAGRQTLESTVSALNTGVAGRHLFSGTAVDAAPLPPADAILDALRPVLAAVTGPADAATALDAFFDIPGGGFDSLVYRGAAKDLAPVQLGAGETAEFGWRADHAALRASIRHAAVAALADDPALSLDQTARRGLLAMALDGALGARDAQAGLQAELGATEARIERASTRHEAQIAALDLARGALLAVDPYEAATELEAVRLQLEAVYTVTVRLSQLNLVNFLS